MVQPSSLKAAQTAGIRAARQVSALFESIISGPSAPAPAAFGVDTARFQQDIARFSKKELVECAKHFGQRGVVVRDIGISFAAEVSRRLQVMALTAEVTGGDQPSRQTLSIPDFVLPFEVATIIYSFSKLSPQLVEYADLYHAVSHGIMNGKWHFNCLQTGLVGTALADVDCLDALTTLLLPQLAELSTSSQAQESLTVDELRFLLHAAVKLPIGVLKLEHIQVLASCTERRLLQGNFAHLAHIMVSWFRLRPVPEAKEAWMKVLRAVCVQMGEFKKAHYPAHPLPPDGLAPILADVLAREADQIAPPLTPPVLRDIVTGLVQISWGIQRYQSSSRIPGRALGIDDWADILKLVIGFCEAHYAVSSRSRDEDSLPAWAAETLYHVLWRASKQRDDSSVSLESLQTLLRIVKRHRSKPEPDPEFFIWAAELLKAQHGRGIAHGSLVAELVRDLVPYLSQEHRTSLTRILDRSRSEVEVPVSPRETSSPLSPRLLSGYSKAPRWLPKVEFSGTNSPFATSSEVLDQPPVESKNVAFVARAAHGGRLWGMLAASQTQAAAATKGLEAPRVFVAATSSSAQPEVELKPQEAPVAKPVASLEKVQGPSTEELQNVLLAALKRVEALEAKLKDIETEKEEATMRKATEVEPESLQMKAVNQGANWLAGIFAQPDVPIQPSPATATLHLSNAFSFDAYRKEHSQRLQAERLRVISPTDYYPLLLCPKK